MNKTISLILAMILLCIGMNAFAEDYAATAVGFGGDVTVTLTIDGDKLSNVVIEGANETPSIGGEAMKKLMTAMMENNSVAVDVMAGATVTSNAILTAASDALAASGLHLTAAEVAKAEAKVLDAETTDVLVIGGGAAGLSAAISAKENGADVILVEKLPMVGGCSAMSAGVILRGAVESDGEDTMSSDELFAFLMAESQYNADEKIVRTYTDNSVDTFNWLYDNMVPDSAVVSRYPLVPESLVGPYLSSYTGGSELVGYMVDYAKKVGVEIRTETSAIELLTEGDKVVGAKVRLTNGDEQDLYGRCGVILATGGFASSKEKLAKYSTPGAENIVSYASVGTVGDGLDMAEKVNAAIHFTDDWDTCGAFTLGIGGYPNDFSHKMLIINAKGERFMNEHEIPPHIYTEMRHQMAEGNIGFWFIGDEHSDQDLDMLLNNFGAVKCETVEELAAATNTPVDVLRATIDEYNAYAGKDNDPFGKPAYMNLGLRAPYYAVYNEPIRTTTIGGLMLTEKSEVLDINGNPIAGLYAAGEVANSNFYGTVYTCGSAFGSAVIFGRIAGANAAANLK